MERRREEDCWSNVPASRQEDWGEILVKLVTERKRERETLFFACMKMIIKGRWGRRRKEEVKEVSATV